MKFQFYRFYLLILIAASVVVWSFNEVVDSFASPEEHYSINVDYLFDAYQLRKAGIEDKSRVLPTFRYIAMHSVALPKKLESALINGKSISIVDEQQQTFYYKLADDKKQILQLGPVASSKQNNDTFVYVILLLYGCLAILLLALMRPVFRDLDRLQTDADNFGRTPVAMQTQISATSSIYPLAKAFNRMSSKIVDFIDMNKDLSRAISHEIRTPLARMKFMLAIISEQINSEQKQQIDNDIKEIELLVNDYLSFAKVEAHFTSDNFSQHSTKAFLKVMRQKFAIYCDEIDIVTESDNNKVYFNRETLALATQNLLTNALRYAESKIIIRFSLRDDRCYLIVEDDGPGIADNAEDLKQPFLREDHLQNNHQGFGLGLYIVKSICILYEGDFQIQRSATLGGAKMLLSWPNKLV